MSLCLAAIKITLNGFTISWIFKETDPAEKNDGETRKFVMRCKLKITDRICHLFRASYLELLDHVQYQNIPRMPITFVSISVWYFSIINIK